ncbi:MAG TPA: phage holin family protein [Mycobacterium sp.]|jgi:VIT1/CCC1 family predicted Fe2+/Mn2+ transporter
MPEEVHVSPPTDRSTSELLGDATEQITRLVKDEVQLALAEMRVKAKRTGLAAGLGGIAAVSLLLGAMVLVATVVIALNLVLAAWLSTLIVGAALVLAALMAALALKVEVDRARPVLPENTVRSIRDDIGAVKGHLTSRDS